MKTPPRLPLPAQSLFLRPPPPPSSQSLSHQPCTKRSIGQRRQQRTKYDAYKCLLLVVAVAVALFVRPQQDPHERRRLVHNPTIATTSNGTNHPTTTKTTTTTTNNDDFSDQSCELISKHPNEECMFATTCNGGDGIFLGHLIYCSSVDDDDDDDDSIISFMTVLSDMKSTTLLWMVSGPLALLLILLFRILGSTAEEFFSPGLAMLSQKLGLPERFAGVTLLALGNGAPDVASTVNAIRNDPKRGYLLALGELLGASMVASTLIVGGVAFVSPTPVHCRGAFVRDVVMFILTMIVVFFAFNDGIIDPREIRKFIVFYIAYVVLVLGADLYHRKFHPTTIHHTSSQEEELTTSSSQKGDDKIRHDHLASETTSLVTNNNSNNNITSSETSQSNPKKSLVERIVDLMTNYDEDKEEDTVVDTMVEGANANITNGSKQPVELHPQGPISSSSTGWGERDEAGDEPLMVFHPHHGGIVNLKQSSTRDLSLASEGHWLSVTTELRTYLQDYLDSIYGTDSEYNRLEKFLMIFELPFTFLRMFTIPVPCEGYYCRPVMALSVALSPVWLSFYFYDQFEINIFEQSLLFQIAVFGLPLIMGILCLRFAPRGSLPPGPLVAAPITMIGFVVSACYLDFIGDKLVDLLTFFGVVLHIPSSIMGITVLAWGNASQDFIANITMARKDLSTMAITGSFAGPVFNILIGLGISYAPFVHRKKTIYVHLDNALRSSFLFCVLNGILMIVAGIWFGKGTIPKQYGYVAAVIYGIYAVVSLTV